MMRPLKVTAHLVSPLASAEGPMLDSILEWVLSFHMSSIQRSKHGVRHKCQRLETGDGFDRPGAIPIPLSRDHDVWKWPIPRCSAPILSKPLFDCVERFNKILDTRNADLLSPSGPQTYNTGGGSYKSYRLPIRTRGVEQVVWFCVGDRRRVKQLLKGVNAIGYKTSIGYGRVAEWSVDWVDEDWSWFAPSEQGMVLMRPLPSEVSLPHNLQGSRQWFGSPIPPYWQRNLFCEIVQPI